MKVERELKLMLASQVEYEAVCGRLESCFEAEVQQRNFYWDFTDGRLRAARVSVRLRIEDSRAFVTVKGPGQVAADGVFEATEDEEEVPLGDAEGVATEPTTGLDGLHCGTLRRLWEQHGDLKGLACWGGMENCRRRYRLTTNALLEVDRTEFPGGIVDWEIEAEAEDPRVLQAQIHELLSGLGIPIRPQTRTKSRRLRDVLGGA